MASQRSIEVARKARVIYEEQLRTRLEATNLDDFVAIEPESGEYFLGKTLSEAIQAARAAHPQRLAFALRVGHRTTVEMGVIVEVIENNGQFPLLGVGLLRDRRLEIDYRSRSVVLE